MSDRSTSLRTDLRERRRARGWSQVELARRAGISRAGLSAIEIGRLVPSTAAALKLAASIGCRVEDIFSLDTPRFETVWVGDVPPKGSRYWEAEVGGARVRFGPRGAPPAGRHDGVVGRDDRHASELAASTLVMATCDPAAPLLAQLLFEKTGNRLLVLPRSSRAALDLLSDGLVHLAGVHLASVDDPEANVSAVREAVGDTAFDMMRVATWEAGLAVRGGSRSRSIRALLRPGVRWVGREAGSGARRCLDDVRGDRRPPRRIAHDHRGVADSIRCGWSDVGPCVRLVSEEAGLRFLSVRQEAYDVCFRSDEARDRRLEAFIETVRSPAYRSLIADLPGYDGAQSGEVRHES